MIIKTIKNKILTTADRFLYNSLIPPVQHSPAHNLKLIIIVVLHLMLLPLFFGIFLFLAYTLISWLESNIGSSFITLWNFLYLKIFPSTMLFLGLLVIALRNPIYALVNLIILFLATALFLISIGVEFLAMIYLIIYIGAIAVLFLFVIMMFNLRDIQEAYTQDRDFIHLSFFVYLFVIIKFYDVINFFFLHYWDSKYSLQKLYSTYYTTSANWSEASYVTFLQDLVNSKENTSLSNDLFNLFVTHFGKIQDIWIFSNTFYTYHSYLFILASILLLSSMIGAIVLALSATEKHLSTNNNKNE